MWLGREAFNVVSLLCWPPTSCSAGMAAWRGFSYFLENWRTFSTNACRCFLKIHESVARTNICQKEKREETYFPLMEQELSYLPVSCSEFLSILNCTVLVFLMFSENIFWTDTFLLVKLSKFKVTTNPGITLPGLRKKTRTWLVNTHQVHLGFMHMGKFACVA